MPLLCAGHVAEGEVWNEFSKIQSFFLRSKIEKGKTKKSVVSLRTYHADLAQLILNLCPEVFSNTYLCESFIDTCRKCKCRAGRVGVSEEPLTFDISKFLFSEVAHLFRDKALLGGAPGTRGLFPKTTLHA